MFIEFPNEYQEFSISSSSMQSYKVSHWYLRWNVSPSCPVCVLAEMWMFSVVWEKPEILWQAALTLSRWRAHERLPHSVKLIGQSFSDASKFYLKSRGLPSTWPPHPTIQIGLDAENMSIIGPCSLSTSTPPWRFFWNPTMSVWVYCRNIILLPERQHWVSQRTLHLSCGDLDIVMSLELASYELGMVLSLRKWG